MIEKTAYYLERNDEEPNIALAVQLCETSDSEGIKEIVQGLNNKKRQVRNDCIKVLYEIGERNPGLISDYVLNFIQLLESKDNRLVWGSMTALSKITPIRPKEVFDHFNTIVGAYEEGSVITRDNSISVFAELVKADKKYERIVFQKITDHLKSCRPKEVGQHAERAFLCVNETNSKEFMSVLLQRREELTENQKKRVDKLIRRIEKKDYAG